MYRMLQGNQVISLLTNLIIAAVMLTALIKIWDDENK